MTRRNCRRVEPLLALAAGGDLSPSRLAAVEKHLADCTRCRESAEAFAATVHTVRELPALELTPDERAELRRGVWKRIERERAGAAVAIGPNRTAWRTAAWAAAALVMLALLLPWRGVREDRSAGTVGLPPSHSAAAPTAAKPAAPLVAAAPALDRPPRIAGRRTHRRARPIPESEATPVRIELSTPDPDVRIVWLVGPAGEALPPLTDDFGTDTTSAIKENPE